MAIFKDDILIIPEAEASLLEEVIEVLEGEETDHNVKSVVSLGIWPGIVFIDMTSHTRILFHSSRILLLVRPKEIPLLL